MHNSKLQIVSDVDINQLAEELAFQADREVVMKFILRLDERMAEEDFTLRLIKKLKASLDEDEPVDDTTIQDIRARFNTAMAALQELDNALNG